MAQLFKRKEITYFTEWARHESHKPLIIRGARQVSKSTLVRQFADASGFSLLEFAPEDAQYSMPVGRVEYFYLGPLPFEDFILALGHEELVQYLQPLSLDNICGHSLPKPIHEKCLSLLKQYWIVGGLPEAIASYVQLGDFMEVSRVLHSIVATYRDGFNKYSHDSARSEKCSS